MTLSVAGSSPVITERWFNSVGRVKAKKLKSLKFNVQRAKVKIKSSYALKIKMQSVKFF